jgi:hypothetical protein
MHNFVDVFGISYFNLWTSTVSKLEIFTYRFVVCMLTVSLSQIANYRLASAFFIQISCRSVQL